jgi:beta-glucosidase
LFCALSVESKEVEDIVTVPDFSEESQRVSKELMQDAYILSLIQKMILEQKISLVHGDRGIDPDGIEYVGYIPAQEQYKIPPLRLQNGPSGAGATYGSQRHLKKATAFPVSAVQAATWNRQLLYKMGIAMGKETRAQGRDVLLAPSVNIVRIPEGGRNFEYFSEDPYLSGKCGVSVIQGIQEAGTMACAKHFTANNQETNRHTVNEIMTERAMREIYLPAFEACVKEGNVASLMASYNRINGSYCSQDPLLLRDILKTEWKFKGFVMTDWGTYHHPILAANGGLDLEMSGHGKFGLPMFREHLGQAIEKRRVKESTLNEMVYRVLYQMQQFGLLNEDKTFPETAMNTKEHQRLALQVALEGIVLLKNEDQCLPLDPSGIKSIALFGDGNTARVTGGGSSKVVPFYEVSPAEGLKNVFTKSTVTYYENLESAKKADVAIIYIFRESAEVYDRKSVSLETETEFIKSISGKYEKTIVMLRTAGSYEMPWIDYADALFQVWYPGQEECNAEAMLLSGEANPSGKLPVTFGVSRSDFPATQPDEFPGIRGIANYREGIYVGYRWFDKMETEPLFPFGHGLSYTTFEIEQPKLSARSIKMGDTIEVTVSVKNTGKRPGAEVVQLYLADPEASVPRPPRELKGFRKVFLQPGESKKVTLELTQRDLSFWDQESDRWKAEPGTFHVLVGASSRDLPGSASFELKARRPGKRGPI